MKTALVRLWLSIVLIALAGRSHAGECLDELPDFLTRLEAGLRERPLLLEQEAWYCLLRYHTAVGGMTNRWAGPRAARKISQRKASRDRWRIARICGAVVLRGEPQQRAEAVKLAAAWGIATLGKQDIFELQQRYLPCGFAADQLAVLGGKRSLDQAIAGFGRAESCSASWSRGQRRMLARRKPFALGWRKNRWRQKAQDEAKISLLNALWHIALPESRSFVERVARTDPGPIVRQRAARVVDHLKRLASDRPD